MMYLALLVLAQSPTINSTYKQRVLDVPLRAEYTSSATVANNRVLGGASCTATGTPPTIAADGTLLDGASDSFTCTPVNLSAGGTMSIWFKATALSGSQFIVSNTLGSTNRSALVLVDANAGGAFYDGALRDGLSCAVQAGVWCHLLMTRSGTTAKTYVNGVLCAGAASGVGSGTAGLFIGKNSDGTPAWFGGSVSDFVMWNRVLSVGDITYLYGRGRKVDVTILDAAVDVTILSP